MAVLPALPLATRMVSEYGSGTNNLYAIYLGIHGDFGENGTGLPDFWCGDDFARTDFQRFARSKYRRVGKLNASWGTQFNDFNQVTYPPAASDAGAAIPGTPQSRHCWLDFIQWYSGSMTKFAGEVCRIARHYFPDAPLGHGPLHSCRPTRSNRV